MNIPFFKMTAEEQAKSKAMLAGWGCLGFGGYLMLNSMPEFGWAAIIYGFSVLGIRDAR